jgi:hypothetical protein
MESSRRGMAWRRQNEIIISGSREKMMKSEEMKKMQSEKTINDNMKNNSIEIIYVIISKLINNRKMSVINGVMK